MLFLFVSDKNISVLENITSGKAFMKMKNVVQMQILIAVPMHYKRGRSTARIPTSFLISIFGCYELEVLQTTGSLTSRW